MLIQSRVLMYTARVTVVVAAIATATMVNTGTSQAARSRIPPTYYPAGAHISYRPRISNDTMDCMWGFFCEGQLPIFHLTTQSELHRLHGWGEFAGWRDNTITFQVFLSHYDAAAEGAKPWSETAVSDFAMALRMNGYRPLHLSAQIVPEGSARSSLTAIQYSGPKDIVAVACWFGSTEIEALTMFPHRSASERQMALTDLAHQVEVAVSRN